MKRNMPSELGWGIGTEGGWSQHSSAASSGSWTSATNQDSISSWQAINKSDSASDAGDDASSGKSVSTVTSVGNATSQSQNTAGSNNTVILQSSSSSSWGTSNPTPTSMDSVPWGSSSSPAPTSIGTIGWSSNTSSLSSNQGQSSNIQPVSNIGSSVGNAGLSVGWPVNNMANTSTLPPSMTSGNQSNSLSSQWQGSTMLGNIGDFSKTTDAGWSNPSSLLDNSKGLGGGGNSDSRMWGPTSDKTSDNQWDTSKTQWGNPALNTGGEPQGVSNTEMSFAQVTQKGLKLPPVPVVPQPVQNSRQEEILRAVENHEGWGSRPIRQDTLWDVETSPKSLRKFFDSSNTRATNVCNSNGTDNWKTNRENTNGGTDAGLGGNSWNTEKDQSSWVNAPKHQMDSNSWNVGGNLDPKTYGTSWGAASGAGDASNKMWGQKPEVCSWGDRSGSQCAPNISSWSEDGDTGPWDDQRRIASGMVGVPVMVPPSPGIGVPAGIARMMPQGMPGMGMTAVGSDNTLWNDGQKSGWNSASSAAIAHSSIDEPWNKPPPTRTGWGDSVHDAVEVDNGTTLWAENAKQGKVTRGDVGPQGQWNTAAVTKPKTPSGYDEASWALAHRAKMPQKIMSSGSNPPTQMRAKLLQHLMDMGYRKEDAQNALITNNMNLEMAINDLKAGNVNLSRKDVEMDMFQANGSQSRMPYMSKGGLVGDDMFNIRPDQVPPFNNMQNTQISNQTFLPNNTSLPPSSLSLNNSSLQHKLMQQQAPPATIGQRVQMPPAIGGTNSQASQQQIRAQLSQAVSNGFISPQLMNYQLPHNILVLIQQLLQLQTALQTAMSSQQQLIQQARASGNRSNPQLEQLAVIVSNIKQQIINVQKQLQQAQNALFSSQKPPTMTQQSPGTVTPQTGVNIGDSLDALSTDLANVALHSQSRLTTQWKPAGDNSSSITSDITGTSTSLTTMKAGDESGDNKVTGAKAVLQSSSSPNLTLIPGGLGMTGDKTWSSSMSTTSSLNWPLSTNCTNSQTEVKSSNSTRITTSLLSGLSSGTDVIPEFVPGKPWQGLTKNVEDDPHLTPGSIQRSLSVNRVHDDSLNHLDGYRLNSSSWGTSLKTDNNLGLSQLGNHPPPGMGLAKGVGTQQWSSPSMNRQSSWPHSSSSAFTKVTGSNWNDSMAPSSWILLKNLTVDPSTVRALCAQHGSVVSFYPLAQGQLALVQYSNRKVAYIAQQELNNFQMGMSVIAAEFINESDAQRFIAQIPPPQPSSIPVMNASPWSQAPPFTPFQNTAVRSGDPWSTATQVNSTKYGSACESPWGLWDRPDYNPNVLSNFLGGESM